MLLNGKSDHVRPIRSALLIEPEEEEEEGEEDGEVEEEEEEEDEEEDEEGEGERAEEKNEKERKKPFNSRHMKISAHVDEDIAQFLDSSIIYKKPRRRAPTSDSFFTSDLSITPLLNMAQQFGRLQSEFARQDAEHTRALAIVKKTVDACAKNVDSLSAMCLDIHNRLVALEETTRPDSSYAGPAAKPGR